MNQDVPGTTVAQDLFEGLLRTDPAGNVVPGVAERWESSADGLTWTLPPAPQRPLVQRRPGHREGLRLCLAPRGGSGHGLAHGAAAGAHCRARSRSWRARRRRRHWRSTALDDYTLAGAPRSAGGLFRVHADHQLHDAGCTRPPSRAQGRGWTQPGVMVSNGAFLLQEPVHQRADRAGEESALLGCGCGATQGRDLLRPARQFRRDVAIPGRRSRRDRSLPDGRLRLAAREPRGPGADRAVLRHRHAGHAHQRARRSTTSRCDTRWCWPSIARCSPNT